MPAGARFALPSAISANLRHGESWLSTHCTRFADVVVRSRRARWTPFGRWRFTLHIDPYFRRCPSLVALVFVPITTRASGIGSGLRRRMGTIRVVIAGASPFATHNGRAETRFPGGLSTANRRKPQMEPMDWNRQSLIAFRRLYFKACLFHFPPPLRAFPYATAYR